MLSIFQAALNSLSRLDSARLRDEPSRRIPAQLLREAAAPPPSRLRVGVQIARQLCLIGSILFAVRLAENLEVRHPVLVGFASVALVFVLVIEQIGARALVLVNPERALRMTLPAAGLVHYALLPLASPVYMLLRWVQGRFASSEENEEPSESEVRAYLAVGEEEGILEAEEGTMIESVIDFSDTLVREVMTPRTEMAAIAESAGMGELATFVSKTRHSRIPVFKGSIDHVTGFVNTRDLFEHWGKESSKTAADFARPVHVVPETKRVSELLKELQASRQQLAIVVDEYGGTAGLVTLEDLLEEIVGEIRDEHEPEDVVTQQDGSRLVRGRLDVSQAGELFGVDLEGDGFETVGGLVEARLGHIPDVGEKLVWRGITFEVVEMDRRRIRRVLMSRAPDPPSGEEDPSRPKQAARHDRPDA